MLTGIEAVEAIDATGHIDTVGAGIDAVGPALARTASAVAALVSVDPYREQGIAADCTQQRPDRADIVAPGPAPHPGAGADHEKGGERCHQQGGHQAAVPAKGGEGTHYPPVCAIGRDKGDEDLEIENDTEHRKGKDPVPEPLALGNEGRLLLSLEKTAQTDHKVLEYAQRADDRTIDASEDEGCEKDGAEDGNIAESGAAQDPHNGRKKLYPGHPAPPVLTDTYEKQGYAQEEKGRKEYSDSFHHSLEFDFDFLPDIGSGSTKLDLISSGVDDPLVDILVIMGERITRKAERNGL